MPVIRRIVRDEQGNEQVWVPHRDEGGLYTLAAPGARDERNHSTNQLKVGSLDEVATRLREEYSLRMCMEDGQGYSLISAKSIEIIENLPSEVGIATEQADRPKEECPVCADGIPASLLGGIGTTGCPSCGRMPQKGMVLQSNRNRQPVWDFVRFR